MQHLPDVVCGEREQKRAPVIRTDNTVLMFLCGHHCLQRENAEIKEI